MFDIFAKLLSSIASFLFPLFASYKALKTSDPAQLTPWLMYWVVLACALLVESWTEWFLVWIPFYAYIRFLFLLYLVLPQTQGARVLYQTYIHPWLEENESTIEDFIASAHERLRSAGISYIKQAIEIVKTNVLGMPATQEPSPPPSVASGGQSYTQSLLSRFSLPSARWGDATGGAGTDLYNLLMSTVNAATNAATGPSSAPSPSSASSATGGSGPAARMRFIAAQRERLTVLLSALDREATQLQSEAGFSDVTRDAPGEDAGRPASGLSKSRSEPDFEKLEAESGAEDMDLDDSGPRRRVTPSQTSGGSWMPWGWGGGHGESDAGKSTAVEK
ncbi:hypothetical protein VTK73DRAFT_8249 [Phialemonium thermophilum]|uniref:Protein YOP1 n=1 Tax=Phialemonium thermophilum TaxID=223376 RepID=A0ABR3XQN4_9PEZI